MTSSFDPNKLFSPDSLQSAIAQVKQRQGGVCEVALSEARRDPKINATVETVKYETVRNAVLLRTPVLGSLIMGSSVAQQGYEKYKKGDWSGAAKTYGAAAVVTATGVVPFIPGVNLLFGFVPLGDAAIEGFRAAGLEIEPSPLNKAYATVMGTKAVCNKLDAEARIMLKTHNNPKDRSADQVIANTPIPKEQAAAVQRFSNFAISTYKAQNPPERDLGDFTPHAPTQQKPMVYAAYQPH